MVIDILIVFIICVINFGPDLNSAVYGYDTDEIENYVREIRDSEDVNRLVENWDDVSGRRASTYGCWVRGGICIDFQDCRNHQFFTQVNGCTDNQKVCCMSYNFRERKDFTSFGFKSSLPWKIQTRDTPYKPTAAQIQTYETSKQAYKDIFDIDIDKPRGSPRSERRSTQKKAQVTYPKSNADSDFDNKMAADYADFYDFTRSSTCDGSQCSNAVEINFDEDMTDKYESLYFNDKHENITEKYTNTVLLLIQKL